jgi:peptide/nickel transport system permease protein
MSEIPTTRPARQVPWSGALRSRRARGVLRLLRSGSAVIGLLLVTTYVVVALFASTLAAYPPIEQHPKDRLQPPSTKYLLGTDEFGRDVLSRLMHGATNSLRVSVLSVAIACLLGASLGMVAGYAGGLTDNVIMRVMDLFFAFPAMLLALSIVTALGAGMRNTILAIALVYMPIFARVARGPVLAVKTMEFVDAARSIGAQHLRILGRHVLPNITAPILVQVSLALSWAMLTEAGLSFLGLGTIPPTPSWGSMLADSRRLMELAPWTAIFPGLAIMFGVLGFNLLGDGLRDVLDPHLRN